MARQLKRRDFILRWMALSRQMRNQSVSTLEKKTVKMSCQTLTNRSKLLGVTLTENSTTVELFLTFWPALISLRAFTAKISLTKNPKNKKPFRMIKIK